MVLVYHPLVHGVSLGCLSVFVQLCCFMSCLLRFLLFDVFYGLYSGGVSVCSDVASCLVFYGFCCLCVLWSVFRVCDVYLFLAMLFCRLLILLRFYMVIYIMMHLLPRMNASLFFA